MKEVTLFSAFPVIPALLLTALLFLFFWYLWRLKIYTQIPVLVCDLFFFIGLILFLVSPVLTFHSSVDLPAKIYLLRDRSLSAHSQSIRNIETKINIAQLKKLVNKHDGELKAALFGNGFRVGAAPIMGDDTLLGRSDLGGAFYDIKSKKNSAAILLISDGNFVVDKALISKDVPVFPILLKNDLPVWANSFIKSLQVSSILDAGKRAQLFVNLYSAQPGQKLQFRVDNRVLSQRYVAVGHQRYKFTFVPRKTGKIIVSVSFVKAKKDSFVADNRLSKILTVVSKPAKVLLLYGYPDPDIKFFRRFVEGLKNYKLTVRSLSSKKELGKDIRQANVLVLMNMPAHLLQRSYAVSIKKMVAKGGGVVFFHGESGSVPESIKELMPFVLSTYAYLGHGKKDIYSEAEFDFFDLSISYLLVGSQARPNAQVLARASGRPFILRHTFGRGNVIAILGGPFWKWDFSSLGYGINSNKYDIFWGTILERALLRVSKLKVSFSKKVVLPGEPFNVLLMGKQLSSNFRVRFVSTTNSAFFYQFKGEPITLGRMNIKAEINKMGNYLVMAGSRGKLFDTGTRLIVRAADSEYKRHQINHKSLEKISLLSGGKIIYTLDKLPTGITFKKENVFSFKRVELMRNPIGMTGLILLLIGGIYYRRKRDNA